MSVGATKRVKWKDIDVGDYAYVNFEYQGNNEVRIIPEAIGVKIRSTDDLGGGYWIITVNAFVAKDSRFALEQFFYNLNTQFTLAEKGDLKISDENGTMTLADCYLESFTPSGEDQKSNSFLFKFVKSL